MQPYYNEIRLKLQSEVMEASELDTTIQDIMEEYDNVKR